MFKDKNTIAINKYLNKVTKVTDLEATALKLAAQMVKAVYAFLESHLADKTKLNKAYMLGYFDLIIEDIESTLEKHARRV